MSAPVVFVDPDGTAVPAHLIPADALIPNQSAADGVRPTYLITEGVRQTHPLDLPSTTASPYLLMRCTVCRTVRTWHKHAGSGRPVRCGYCNAYTDHDPEWVEDHLIDLLWILDRVRRVADVVRFVPADQLGIYHHREKPADRHNGRQRAGTLDVTVNEVRLVLLDTLPPWSLVRVLRSFWTRIGTATYPGSWQLAVTPEDSPLTGWVNDRCLLVRLDAAAAGTGADGWPDIDKLDLAGPCQHCTTCTAEGVA